MRIIVLIISMIWSMCVAAQDPIQFQPSPYKSGILKATIEVIDDGDTSYLYQHVDSLVVPTALKVKDTPTMKLRIVGDTIRADIKKRLNAGTVGGSDKFLYIQYDSTGQIIAISQLLSDDFDKDPYNEFQSLVIDSLGRRFTIGITDGNEVSFIDQLGVTDTTYINQLISDSIAAIVFPKDSLYANGDPGHISIIGGNEVDINVNDADSNPTNEIQTLSFSMPNLSIGGGNTVNLTGLINDADSNPYNELQTISIIDSTDRVFQIRLHPENQLIKFRDSVGLTEMDTSLISQIISDSLAAYTFETDTSLINQLISDSLATINQDQIISLTGAGITNITGTYPSFTVTSTEVDGSTTNEIQTLSQSFTGTTEATYSLNLSGGSVKDTTGFMRLETMFSTAGSRTYRYKSNLGAIMGITEDPTLSGNSNIEVLRTGNQLTWGLRKDNASNGQIYKYNGTAWALSSDVSGITSLNGLTPSTQTFATGTSGTDFNISSATSTHTFNLPTASASNRGLLSSANWTTFNNKLDPSTTFGPDVTGTYNNLRGKYMQWNADLGFDANTFSSGKFTFRYVNAGVPSPGNVYGLLEVPLAGSTSNWQIGSRITDNLLYFRNNNATTGTWQQIFSTLNLPNGIKYGDDLSFDFNTNPANNTQAIRYAYANTNSPDGNAYDGFDVRRNNTYGWQMAKNGTSPLYVRGRTTSTWGSWEIVPTLSTGTAVTLYGLSSTNKLVPLGLTGLTISGGNLVGAAPLSGTTGAIPYFNTTSTLSSTPFTYGSNIMTIPTGNSIYFPGTATIIDKNASGGSAGEFLSRAASGGGMDWVAAPETDISTFTKSGTDIPIISSTGSGFTLRDGTNISNTELGGTLLTINTDISYGYMRTSSSTISLTTSLQKIAVSSPLNNGVITASDANDRFTVSQTGVYEIIYDIDYSYNQNTLIEFNVYKNGTTLINQCDGRTTQSDLNNSHNISKGAIVQLNASDYIELFTKSGVSCTGTFNNINFSIKRID